jgi:hydroxymethylpyrimidine/phosphomethylpyrimidine kinase
MTTRPCVLTIAGSDSSGGAGIQADIKTITCTGSYAASVITAITAQNTVDVIAIQVVEPELVKQQIMAVFEDLTISAIKIGMLFSDELIKLVAELLQYYEAKHIVLDPVMYAKSGQSLINSSAITALEEYLFPLAELITPNIPEAELLTNISITDPTSMIEAARLLQQQYNCSALIKAGHLNSINCEDILLHDGEIILFKAKRIQSINTHGTGCTLSSAISSYLAQGYTLSDAIKAAKDYLTCAIKRATNWNMGKGHGPVDHFEG